MVEIIIALCCHESLLTKMYLSSILLALAGFVAYISARPSLGTREQASFDGIATFNDYSYQLQTQGSTVCGGQAIPGRLPYGRAPGINTLTVHAR